MQTGPLTPPRRRGYPANPQFPKRVDPDAAPEEPVAGQQGATAARRRWSSGLLGIVLPLALILLIAGGVAAFLAADNPQRAIRQYLNALIAGDAERARAVTSSTAGILVDQSLLTDEALRSLKDTGRGLTKVYAVRNDSADVELAGQRRTLRFEPFREDRSWRISNVEVFLDGTRGLDVRVLGKVFETGKSIELFPGVYEIQSANDLYVLKEKQIEAFSPAEPVTLFNDASLASDLGRMNQFIKGKLVECTKLKLSAPPNCPWKLPKIENGSLVEETLVYELVGEPKFGTPKVDPQTPLVIQTPVTFTLHVTADGVKTDGTKGRYDSTGTFSSTASVSTQDQLRMVWINR